jgi:hypothetical protein
MISSTCVPFPIAFARVTCCCLNSSVFGWGSGVTFGCYASLIASEIPSRMCDSMRWWWRVGGDPGLGRLSGSIVGGDWPLLVLSRVGDFPVQKIVGGDWHHVTMLILILSYLLAPMHDDHPLSAVDTIVGRNPRGCCMQSMDMDVMTWRWCRTTPPCYWTTKDGPTIN